MHQRVEDNAFHIHSCELPCEIERAELWPASVPIVERTAGCDLEFIVAGLAPNVAPHVIAAAFATPLAVHEPDFTGDDTLDLRAS